MLVVGGAQSSIPLQAVQGGRGVQSVTSREAYRQKIALVVGIDDYDPQVGELQYAVKDAQDVSRLLETEFGFKVQLLLNEHAKRDAVLSAIHSLRDQTSREDQLLFFFAGHGISFGEGDQERGYIISQNVSDKSESIVGTMGIPMGHLVDLFLSLPPKHILIILDTCYSGLAAAKSRGTPGNNPELLLGQLTSRPARHLLSAGKSDQKAKEHSKWGNSAFTADLLIGLGERKADSGKLDGLITASELSTYLQSAVSERTGGDQTPHFSDFGPGQGEFVFIEKPAWQPSLTKEGVRKKVILNHPEIPVFRSSYSQERLDVETWKPYYLFEGEENRRTPIGLEEQSENPSGWVETGGFAEWNSLEVALVPPKKLTGTPIRLFSDRECAVEFSKETDTDKGTCPYTTLNTAFWPAETPAVFALLERWGDVYRVLPIPLPGTAGDDGPAKKQQPLQIGWLPKKKGMNPLVQEAVLMRHTRAKFLASLMEAISWAAEDGQDEGIDTFKRQVNTAFSAIIDRQLDIDEQLDGLLVKLSVLPFRTTALAFTLAEVKRWKTGDFSILYQRLSEKVLALRAFLQDPKNKYSFNGAEIVFVPREFFP